MAYADLTDYIANVGAHFNYYQADTYLPAHIFDGYEGRHCTVLLRGHPTYFALSRFFILGLREANESWKAVWSGPDTHIRLSPKDVREVTASEMTAIRLQMNEAIYV